MYNICFVNSNYYKFYNYINNNIYPCFRLKIEKNTSIYFDTSLTFDLLKKQII